MGFLEFEASVHLKMSVMLFTKFENVWKQTIVQKQTIKNGAIPRKSHLFYTTKNFERARNRLPDRHISGRIQGLKDFNVLTRKAAITLQLLSPLLSMSTLNHVRCSLPHRSFCFWCQPLWFSLRSKLNNRAYARMEKGDFRSHRGQRP